MSLGWIDGCRGAVPVNSFFPMASKPARPRGVGMSPFFGGLFPFGTGQGMEDLRRELEELKAKINCR